MSFSEVDALMGKSQQSCWEYRDGVVERIICFRDKKVSSIATSENQPGKNQAHINAIFTTDEQIRATGHRYGLTLGASPRRVADMFGPPRAIIEHFDDSAASYRATFVDGKLITFQNVTPPAS